MLSMLSVTVIFPYTEVLGQGLGAPGALLVALGSSIDGVVLKHSLIRRECLTNECLCLGPLISTMEQRMPINRSIELNVQALGLCVSDTAGPCASSHEEHLRRVSLRIIPQP